MLRNGSLSIPNVVGIQIVETFFTLRICQHCYAPIRRTEFSGRKLHGACTILGVTEGLFAPPPSLMKLTTVPSTTGFPGRS